jgi:hypothetical protein
LHTHALYAALTRDLSRDPTINPVRRSTRRDEPARNRPPEPEPLWLQILLLFGTAATFSLSALALAASAVLVLCMLS